MPGSSASPEAHPGPVARFSVVLTGGVASGKSAAASFFADLGARVIDADVIARELVAPGLPALDEIVDAFGPRILADDGGLDRRALRHVVFADPSQRRRLEGILHPRIAAEMHARAESTEHTYNLLVVPLYVEGGRYRWADRVAVVDVPRALQRERLLRRDGVDDAVANAMLDAQASREQRLAAADDVIDNTGSLEDLRGRVRVLHDRYRESDLALAARRPPDR